MTVWAFKGPSSQDYAPQDYDKVIKYLTKSVRAGVSRYGYGFHIQANLELLKEKRYVDMTDIEKLSWAKCNFLLGIKKGDWIIHVNVPSWTSCIAGKVVDTYHYETEENDIADFHHTLMLDKKSLVEFNRNEMGVLPIISSRLKLQGSHWHIPLNEFTQTVENIRIGDLDKVPGVSKVLFYLKKDLSPVLRELTGRIQKTHPPGYIEEFLCQVFSKVPNVTQVVENGRHKGWGTDNGADLIVYHTTGLSITPLEKESKLVVYIKSYVYENWETNAVDQVERGLKEFEADSALIIITAESTCPLEESVDKLMLSTGKPIGVMAGEELAKFILKYGSELML